MLFKLSGTKGVFCYHTGLMSGKQENDMVTYCIKVSGTQEMTGAQEMPCT